jgi:predicted metal-dependent phosphoesterase TrpH
VLDLHVHSTFSDGSESPRELAERGARAGIRALALTDHDNLRGAALFLEACRAQGIAGLTGVEISAEVPDNTLHILGYGVDPADAELRRHLDQVLDGRAWRNRQILEKLNALGLELSWEEVASCAGDDVVGRPHFAQALCKRGYVAGVPEAFQAYLAKGAPAYVDRYRLSPAEGIRLIRAAGGVAAMAHPFTWISDPAQLERALVELRSMGLGGIEAYYPEHSAEQTVAYLRLARRLNLLVTGGTDFHGAILPGRHLGTGNGQFEVPDSCLPPLLAALPSRVGVTVPA